MAASTTKRRLEHLERLADGGPRFAVVSPWPEGEEPEGWIPGDPAPVLSVEEWLSIFRPKEPRP